MSSFVFHRFGHFLVSILTFDWIIWLFLVTCYSIFITIWMAALMLFLLFLRLDQRIAQDFRLLIANWFQCISVCWEKCKIANKNLFIHLFEWLLFYSSFFLIFASKTHNNHQCSVTFLVCVCFLQCFELAFELINQYFVSSCALRLQSKKW